MRVRLAHGCALAAMVLGALLAFGPARPHVAHADTTAAGLDFTPTLGAPVAQLQLIGASPGEAAGEVWAQNAAGTELLQHTNADAGWVTIATAGVSSWTDAAATQAGGVALAAGQELVLRDPGGAFAAASAPPSTGASPVLAAGESLFGASASSTGATRMVAISESSGGTGALIAPVLGTNPSAAPGILHYDGNSWSREPICTAVAADGTCTPAAAGVDVLALAAADPSHAWALVQGAGGASSTPVLYQRVSSGAGSPYWLRVTPASGALGGTGKELPAGQPAAGGPLLTATTQGVWVDLQSGSISETVLVAAGSGASTIASYCYPVSGCPNATGSLGAAWPTGSFASQAWAGSGSSDPGARIVTGINGGLALLRLVGAASAFSYIDTAGPNVGATAAFTDPTDGWLGQSNGNANAPVQVTAAASGEGSAVRRAHASGAGSGSASGTGSLTSWPVDFREPLTAIAGQPGQTAGAAGAAALAVGEDGEVARYTPAAGWAPEYLYNSAGVRQTPNLRGVAWPQPQLAFAVGDGGAMWRYNGDTGLWESDPGKPYNFEANLTAIAFDPDNPNVGYAVGKQGVLLSYERSWVAQSPPAGLASANFESVAFAGDQALVAFRIEASSGSNESGGVIENSGGGWQIDSQVAALLAALPASERVITKVAGLPGGGAVAAGPGVVIERDSAGGAWHLASEQLPVSELQNVAALAAIQTSGGVQALIATDTDQTMNPADALYQHLDNPVGGGTGAPSALIAADPLDTFGFLLRQTDTGWQDLEGGDYSAYYPASGSSRDLPGWPAAVLALDVDPAGDTGWVVGGQTGEQDALSELTTTVDPKTASVQRLGAGPTPPAQAQSAITTASGEATFALGGGAQCAALCADLVNQDIGPDAWLSEALREADSVSGLHAFLYSGGRLAAGASGAALSRELGRYAQLLQGGSGTAPAYAAIDPDDGSVSAFSSALGSAAPVGAVPAGTAPVPSGLAAYVLSSAGQGGTVRVIVLDQSAGATGSAQIAWVNAQLAAAKAAGVPALVLGNRDIVSAPTADDTALAAALVRGGASAYLFDSAPNNVVESVSYGGSSIPALGSGSLGYGSGAQTVATADLTASGFMLVSVDVAGRDGTTNVAPVSEQLEPVIGSLAIDATGGTLLRRSSAYLFDGLAQRPDGGYELGDLGSFQAPDPYVPIPQTCSGSTSCAHFIAPSYTFTSSNPDIADFVAANPSSTGGTEVLEGTNGKPIQDSQSGLLCAYNAGTTTITLSTGGLSYSLKLTVQAGSVEQPCGTVPLSNPPVVQVSQPSAPVAPAPVGGQPTPTFKPSTPSLNAPSPSPTPARPAHVVHHVSVHKPVAVPTPSLGIVPVVAIVPPPVATPAQPVPPSGSAPVNVTQPVSQTAMAPEDERQHEHAVDMVQNMAAVRDRTPTSVLAGRSTLARTWARETGTAAAAVRGQGAAAGTDLGGYAPVLLGLAGLLALAGAGYRRRGGGRAPAYASVQQRQPRPSQPRSYRSTLPQSPSSRRSPR